MIEGCVSNKVSINVLEQEWNVSKCPNLLQTIICRKLTPTVYFQNSPHNVIVKFEDRKSGRRMRWLPALRMSTPSASLHRLIPELLEGHAKFSTILQPHSSAITIACTYIRPYTLMNQRHLVWSIVEVKTTDILPSHQLNVTPTCTRLRTLPTDGHRTSRFDNNNKKSEMPLSERRDKFCQKW